MILIVGLGNPGNMYDKTYHNTGFMVIDKLANKLGCKINHKECKGLTATTLYNGEKIILCKPQTYMNLSGECVRGVVNKYKIPSQNVYVILDDIDLPVGNIRYRTNGSAGTHNGLRNICLLCDGENFNRIRIGIGKDENLDLANYVTSKITDDNLKVLNNSFDKAVDLMLEKLNG